MIQKLTFHNILDDIPWSKKRKNRFQSAVIELITTRIAEVQRNIPVQRSDIEGFTQHASNLYLLWEKYYESDEHKKEVYGRLCSLLSEKIYAWENP